MQQKELDFALVLEIICVDVSILFEYLFRKITKRTNTISDLSAAVTGLLPGCYTLTETKVPAGFRDSLGAISLKVPADGTVIVTKPNVFVEVDGQGALLKIKNQHEDVDLTLEKQLLHSTVTTKFSFTVTYITQDGSTLQETVKLQGGEQKTLTLPYPDKQKRGLSAI